MRDHGIKAQKTVKMSIAQLEMENVKLRLAFFHSILSDGEKSNVLFGLKCDGRLRNSEKLGVGEIVTSEEISCAEI